MAIIFSSLLRCVKLSRAYSPFYSVRKAALSDVITHGEKATFFIKRLIVPNRLFRVI